ncbi:transglutaminase family protein [uncultured Methanobrevibacter sp.]|jgi:transglutaminase-like putative cysteine protease|uniref:transglutaminase-like domain-containing protein n=1 Tax=Methanobrevibacter sp. TaxID=66852 RepID=UPI0025EFFCAB|nr:transglutaminase family protein [uncultured Methanobrevibacter sp.]
MEDYLIETPSIDYMNFHIQERVRELKNQSEDNLDYIKRSYIFVRDEILHSWDIETNIVSRTASDVLKNKTGICWTKSCLLAALLRADGIPSGISYQLLTRADDASEGYMIHALNTVYIKDLNKWIRLDARGNKENINAYFSLDEENLAYKIRSEMGEIDYHDNHADLDERLVNILMQSESIQEITTDFEF